MYGMMGKGKRVFINDDWIGCMHHKSASRALDEICNKVHAIISYIDSGIDMANTYWNNNIRIGTYSFANYNCRIRGSHT